MHKLMNIFGFFLALSALCHMQFMAYPYSASLIFLGILPTYRYHIPHSHSSPASWCAWCPCARRETAPPPASRSLWARYQTDTKTEHLRNRERESERGVRNDKREMCFDHDTNNSGAKSVQNVKIITENRHRRCDWMMSDKPKSWRDTKSRQVTMQKSRLWITARLMSRWDDSMDCAGEIDSSELWTVQNWSSFTENACLTR